ncbi:MAG: universal stress protein [Bacteroidia bacterium]|nr:universal stress protein [Bacteroidia bacterium]
MAMLIPNFMLVLKDAAACKQALEISAKIANYFNSEINCLSFDENTQTLQAKLGGAKITIDQSTSGSVIKEILRTLKDKNADLVILPITPASGGGGVISASEANKLIESFERSALTVPCNNLSFDLSHIIIPIDTSFETRQKVPYAVSLAKAFNATLHIVGVSNDKGKDAEVVIKNYTRQVCNNVEEKGINCTCEMRIGGNPTTQILEFAKEKKAGLILIMTEQETNLTSFFSGKYSEQMIKTSPIPVLSIHPKDLIISDARL